jgi:hypothetical protein
VGNIWIYLTFNIANSSLEERMRGLLLPEPKGNRGVSLVCQAEEVLIVINVTQKIC